MLPDSPQEAEIERLLLRHRPNGPPAALRHRILGEKRVARRWPRYCFRTALAALLLISVSLHLAAGRMNAATAATIGSGSPRWTPEAEQAADLLNAGAAGRQYVALCLVADTKR